MLELHKTKNRSQLFIKRFDKNIQTLIDTFKKKGQKRSLLMKDQGRAEMFTKQQFSGMWESLGVI